MYFEVIRFMLHALLGNLFILKEKYTCKTVLCFGINIYSTFMALKFKKNLCNSSN